MKAVIELHYLPSLAYFSAIRKYEEILLECHEYFVKQTFRNRCQINTSQGRATLVIPVTGKHGKVPVSKVSPDYSQKWLNNHWRAIRAAYGKAPYFEYYADDLHDILYQKHEFLYDLNRALLTMCLRWLRYDLQLGETISYEKQYNQGFDDLRSQLMPGNTEFAERVYRPVPYHQVFGSTFAANLSVLDVVFCCGPEASRILESASKRE